MTQARRSFGDRLLGAVKLDAGVFEEVEHDVDAVGQAAGVVALAGVAQGLGAIHSAGAGSIIAGLVASFSMWILATAIVWAVGVKIFEHTSTFDELLRTLGFAWAPQLVLALGIVPLGPLAGLLWIAVLVLVLAAFVIAVRQALDVTTGRALLICALGVLPAASFGALFVGVTLL
jgi:hypothetical protein